MILRVILYRASWYLCPATSYQMFVPILFQPHPTADLSGPPTLTAVHFHLTHLSCHLPAAPTAHNSHGCYLSGCLSCTGQIVCSSEIGEGKENKGKGERGRGKKRTRNKYVGCQSAIHVPSLPSPTQNPAQNNFFIFGKRKESRE